MRGNYLVMILHDLFAEKSSMEDDRDEFNIVDKKSLNNEVIGNVLRGLLYGISDEDLVNSIDQFFTADDVYEARKLLVKNFYDLFEDEEEPGGLYMGPKEREIKKDTNNKNTSRTNNNTKTKKHQ